MFFSGDEHVSPYERRCSLSAIGMQRLTASCCHSKKVYMKSFLLLFVAALLFGSCKKERGHASATALNGQWKMVKVIEATTGFVTLRPASINRDVVMNMTVQSATSGTINGHTPTNTLSGEFTTAATNRITIPGVAASKVMETPWGALFLDNITMAQTYNVDCNELRINTTNNTLFFQKQ